MSGLSGKTILTTRPADDEDALSELLGEQGAHIVKAPMIRFAPPVDAEPLGKALARASQYRAVLLTSPRSVRAVVGQLSVHSPVIAISGRTRRDARVAGLHVLDLRNASDGTELGRAVLEWLGEGAAPSRFLLPTSDIATPKVADELRARGHDVDVVVAYRTLPVERMDDDVKSALLAGRVHAVVCMSPSAVEALCALVDVEALRGLVRVAPGQTTAAAWEKAGLPATQVAAGPTAEQMLRALLAAWG